jgi:exosortase/archaeosortase family protein
LSLLLPFLVGILCITGICAHFLRREPRWFIIVYIWSAGLFMAVMALETDPNAVGWVILKNACIGLGVVLLGAGWLYYDRREGHLLAIFGWQGLGMYWMLEVGNYLFLHPEDPTNVILYAPALALFSVFCIYEWKAFNGAEPRRSLKFMAGMTFVASGVYFLFAKVALFSTGLVWVTAAQTSALVNLLGMNTSVGLPAYDPVTGEIMVPVLGSGISIILACTAIEAMVIFLGAFLTVEPRENPWKAYKKITPTMRSYQKMSGRERKARALVYTLVPIWVLNLVRNMAIIWLVNNTGMSFDVAHGYIGKGFSFLVLLALAMIVFDLVPEIYDDLLDLYHLGQPEKDKGRKGQEVEGSEGKKAKEEKDKKPEKKMKSQDEEE